MLTVNAAAVFDPRNAAGNPGLARRTCILVEPVLKRPGAVRCGGDSGKEGQRVGAERRGDLRASNLVVRSRVGCRFDRSFLRDFGPEARRKSATRATAFSPLTLRTPRNVQWVPRTAPFFILLMELRLRPTLSPLPLWENGHVRTARYAVCENCPSCAAAERRGPAALESVLRSPMLL